jgi:large subunit ribosomal protein L25
VTISCDKQDFLRIYKSAGYSMPITLKGNDVDQLVLIHDIQVDPVTDFVLHVDFITLKKGQKVQTEVLLVVE